MPSAKTTCRSCSRTIRAGTIYCVSCATRQADSDAAVFDRWLGLFFGGAGFVIVMLAAYVAARYLNILA
ncbi:hypothetical protein MKL09_26410 [Methylobacterium sp. J-048]|uniref:hypothetical protein n=1 Tax=Methylobacterium sp. J-048 TaxID=2836635 RepID=UPI001FBAEE74|nr:hypothetical protein [Methylobacterium sp. J-048]MCJ2060055.1 hypothetical protein [Methylobacterium sp. J-048]